MEEKKADNAEARAQEEEEEEEEEEPILSDRESEEGGGVDHDEGDDEKPVQPTSPKKKKVLPPKSPKKKKVTSAGMQIPEYWPWEEAKKLFITPDVVKADDMEVSRLRRGGKSEVLMIQVEWKAPDVDGLVEFLCRDKGFKYVCYPSPFRFRANRAARIGYEQEPPN